MILNTLILLPLLGFMYVLIFLPTERNFVFTRSGESVNKHQLSKNANVLKTITLCITILNLVLSLVSWFLFDNSSENFQFMLEHHKVGSYDFILGMDGLSVYFVLLTTLIAPISLIANWKSITEKTTIFLAIILLLEAVILLIFLVVDLIMFYIFFEAILAPLFLLIGILGSTDRIRAGFYFFLYTFLGSLFMLLSIITLSSLIGTTDMQYLAKMNFAYLTQIFVFLGIFIAFAVKTPVIFLNSWLLKAHVESPLSGSVILAAIVLKLSLYGVFRLVLPLVPKSFTCYTYIVFTICVVTILYASLSTIRTVDVKELVAYSSVSHAAVYFAGTLSNSIIGTMGGILLGLAHGFVSSGLFMIVGGILYDRSHTRTIGYYSGIAQIMPILAVLFFILCLGNCGAPLTLNFVGEFMSLYGVFERLPSAGMLASTSIVFSAAYTIYMYNRISFGGAFPRWNWLHYLSDVNFREYLLLLILSIFTVILGIYPSIILDTLSYATSCILYGIDASEFKLSIYTTDITHCGFYINLGPLSKSEFLGILSDNRTFEQENEECSTATHKFMEIFEWKNNKVEYRNVGTGEIKFAHKDQLPNNIWKNKNFEANADYEMDRKLVAK